MHQVGPFTITITTILLDSLPLKPPSTNMQNLSYTQKWMLKNKHLWRQTTENEKEWILSFITLYKYDDFQEKKVSCLVTSYFDKNKL